MDEVTNSILDSRHIWGCVPTEDVGVVKNHRIVTIRSYPQYTLITQ